VSTNPEIANLVATLAELAVRNTAGAVATRIKSWRVKGANEETINELVELINELIAERAQLVSIAQAFEAELAGQRMTDGEINYIIEKLIPTVERIADKAGADGQEIRENMDMVRDLVSTESMTILQLVGFNFRAAVGAPLTRLVEQFILSRVPTDDVELQKLTAEREIVAMRLATDPEAIARLRSLYGN
jgi:hypothetical protein